MSSLNQASQLAPLPLRATQSITGAPLSFSELMNPSRVEGISVNKKLKDDATTDYGISNKAIMSCLDLQEGNWYTARNCMVQLRQSTNDRIVFMEAAVSYCSGSGGGTDLPLKALEEWVFIEPNNQDGRLLYGLMLIASANKALNDPAGNKEERRKLFLGTMTKAQQELEVAVECNPTDALPYSCLLAAIQDAAKAKEIFETFRNRSKDTHNMRVHEAVLTKLTSKYGGSTEEMLAFARANTFRAPVGHALWTLLPRAHIKVWEEGKENDKDASTDDYWKNLPDSDKKDMVKSYRRYRSKVGSNDQNKGGNDVLAFCLFKVRAYKEAFAEFTRIGDKPNTNYPWCLESDQYEQVYDKYRTKVHEYCTKKNVDTEAVRRQISKDAAGVAKARLAGRINSIREAGIPLGELKRSVSIEAAKIAAQKVSDKEHMTQLRRTVSKEAAALAAKKAAVRRTESNTEVYVNSRNVDRTISHEAEAAARRKMRFGYK